MDNNEGGGAAAAAAPPVDVDAAVAAAVAAAYARPWEGWNADTDVLTTVAEIAFRAIVRELSNDPTLEGIRTWVEAFPIVVKFEDKSSHEHKNWNLLHYAVFYSAPRDVLKYLMYKNPRLPKQWSGDGLLPIHLALRSGASRPTVATLSMAWRGALLATTPDGNTPLHIAAAHATDPRVVRHLASFERRALEVPNAEGHLPLHVAVRRRAAPPPVPGSDAPTENVDIVGILHDEFPEGLHVVAAEDGANAFHLAAACASTAMLEFLRDKYRQARSGVLCMKDDAGALPVHWAAETNDRASVEWLADRYPQGLRVKTKRGNLPLHLAARDNNIEVNQLFVERYPEGLRTKAKDGSYPLHRSAEENSAEVVQFYVDMTPDLLHVATADESLPLHLAALYNYNEAAVRLLCDLSPDAARATTKNGSYPVHRARTLASAELLATAYPDALEIMNRDRLLPYHVAAARADSDEGIEGLDVVYYLLRTKPDAIGGGARRRSAAAAAAGPQRP